MYTTIPKFAQLCEDAIASMFGDIQQKDRLNIDPHAKAIALWLVDPNTIQHQYWVEKFVRQYKDNNSSINEGILVLPNNPTQGWFQILREEATCLCWLSQSVTTTYHSQLVAYFGHRPEDFYYAFRDLGCCVQEMIPGIHFGE